MSAAGVVVLPDREAWLCADRRHTSTLLRVAPTVAVSASPGAGTQAMAVTEPMAVVTGMAVAATGMAVATGAVACGTAVSSQRCRFITICFGGEASRITTPMMRTMYGATRRMA